MDKWFARQALKGKLFHSADTVAITLTAITAASTGCILYNPPTSTQYLVIKDFRFAYSTDPGVSTVGVEVSPAVSSTLPTSTTANTIVNGLNQGTDVGSGSGLCYSAATLPAAPVRLLGAFGAVGVQEPGGPMVIEINGGLILSPGTSANLGFLTNAAVGIGSVTWAEIPTADARID